jgi:hypothetical protein
MRAPSRSVVRQLWYTAPPLLLAAAGDDCRAWRPLPRGGARCEAAFLLSWCCTHLPRSPKCRPPFHTHTEYRTVGGVSGPLVVVESVKVR